jgi:hypothetical protein
MQVSDFQVADPVIRVILSIQMRHGGVEAGPDTANAMRPTSENLWEYVRV